VSGASISHGENRDFRKFLAGAFFVSSGIVFYLYLADVSVPLLGTSFVETPQISGGRYHHPFHPLLALFLFALFLFALFLFWLRQEAKGLKRTYISPNC